MKIGALQKTSLLDFPSKISAIIFTQACNFACPYCYNTSLVLQEDEELDSRNVLDFLAKRKHLLEGVVITGGEPSLQKDLVEFCQELKKMNYAIKLDTNGSNSKLLANLLSLNLLDYVAMDIKADPKNYPKTISTFNLGDNIIQSIELLKNSSIQYEFRIPCVSPFINLESMRAVLEAIQGSPSLFLQKVRLENILNPDFFKQEGRILTDQEIIDLKILAEKYVTNCSVR